MIGQKITEDQEEGGGLGSILAKMDAKSIPLELPVDRVEEGKVRALEDGPRVSSDEEAGAGGAVEVAREPRMSEA